MTAAVSAADEWADWVVVTVHWGKELDREPRPDDVERTQAMIDAGADVIFGHHAHRLQPFEIVGERPVFWGLGNFVWPNFSGAGSETGVGRVVISPTGEISGCLVPAVIESSGHPVLTARAFVWSRLVNRRRNVLLVIAGLGAALGRRRLLLRRRTCPVSRLAASPHLDHAADTHDHRFNHNDRPHDDPRPHHHASAPGDRDSPGLHRRPALGIGRRA